MSSAGWRPISERPDFMSEPMRQFVIVEGSRDHSGYSWSRRGWGIAHPCQVGEASCPWRYEREDIERICQESNIDLRTAVVTHWMPAEVPRFPSQTERDQNGTLEGATARAPLP